MKFLFFFVLFFSISGALFATESNVYAHSYMSKEVTALIESIKKFDEKSFSVNDAKMLRYNLSQVRLYLDVFLYTYPITIDESLKNQNSTFNSLPTETDIALNFRVKLDNGYDVLGSYKDHMETVDSSLLSPDLVQKLRGNIVNWRRDFLNGSEQLALNADAYQYYFSLVPPNSIAIRPIKQLAKWTWRYISYFPKTGESAEEILSHMSFEIAEKAKEEYAQVLNKVQVLPDTENNETFHNFRKRIRTLYKIMKEFGGYYRTDFRSEYAQFKLNKASDKYGDLHDTIVSFEFSKELGAGPDVLDNKRHEIEKGWQQLKDWQDGKILDALNLLTSKYFVKSH